ncbi:MAG: hypothetical protein NT018_01925 [Armatimonadetes bacterium]|nr:hypothetical protein [Armatimonadota bacterium]
MSRFKCILILIVVAMLAMPAGYLVAQETPPTNPPPAATEPPAAESTPPVVTPAPAPAATAFVAPAIMADTSIFRRTPVIDGMIEDGEWDAFYAFAATGWDATTFVDWDGANLYIGVKSSKPIDLQAVIDCNSDGWFNGDDNYEFKTTGGASGATTLIVSKYNSRNTKIPIAAPVSQDEASLIDIKNGRTDTTNMIEMKIPAMLIKGLKMTPDRKIGLQINLNAGDAFGGWIPTKDIGDTRECTLVTKKFAALKPLDLGFVLRNERVARGDEVVGKFHLTNTGAESVDVRSYVIGGEGKAGEFLSSQKVRTEGISPKSHLVHEVKSIVPSDMRLGSWAIGAEVRSRTERLGSALISFEVVEPFEIELKLPSKKIKPDVKDITFAVVVRNNTRGRIRGTAKISLPTGWELWRNVGTKEFSAPQGDGLGSASFKAKPPLGVSGDVPVKMSVTVGGRTIETEGKIVIATP